jgi:putative Mg2+ transporter-C (MgtC) family protein
MATHDLSDLQVLARVGTAFGLAYAFGFERHLRGSPAGERTFAIVGGVTAAIVSCALNLAPQAVSGLVTGVGFIGAGVVLHNDGGPVRGITTAAAIFASAGLGIVVGFGYFWVAIVLAGVLLMTLEIPFVRGLRMLDASRYAGRVSKDSGFHPHLHRHSGPVSPATTAATGGTPSPSPTATDGDRGTTGQLVEQPSPSGAELAAESGQGAPA